MSSQPSAARRRWAIALGFLVIFGSQYAARRWLVHAEEPLAGALLFAIVMVLTLWLFGLLPGGRRTRRQRKN